MNSTITLKIIETTEKAAHITTAPKIINPRPSQNITVLVLMMPTSFKATRLFLLQMYELLLNVQWIYYKLVGVHCSLV